MALPTTTECTWTREKNIPRDYTLSQLDDMCWSEIDYILFSEMGDTRTSWSDISLPAAGASCTWNREANIPRLWTIQDLDDRCIADYDEINIEDMGDTRTVWTDL